MHLPNDPRERAAAGTPEARWKFYFEMLDVSYEAAVRGLMAEYRCPRAEALARLAAGYARRDAEKLASWAW